MRSDQILALIRPAQWVKNAFVAAPLFFTPSAVSWSTVWLALVGIASFCLVSSASYILNDYVDRHGDRAHPVKRHRPLAADTIAVPVAFALFVLLLLAGFGLALTTTPGFVTVLGTYLLLTLAYSLVLKRVAILDVMVIALGFVLRIFGGAALIALAPSAWIVVMTGLLALFLALAKRRDDLCHNLDRVHRPALGGYTLGFVDTAAAIVTGALLVAYLIYTTDQSVVARLGTDRLYYTAPFVVFGILRYLNLALVEGRAGSPTSVMLGDPLIIATVLGWMATFGYLLYG